MLTLIRSHWSKISAGMLVATLLGFGGAKLYRHFVAGDCCQPGASCCYPGSPCCHGHQLAMRD
jgi:hypothetical protein